LKLIETNAALGYNEVAYFIEVEDKEYLCIYENQDADNFWKSYRVGEIEIFDDSEFDIVIEEKHDMILEQSPLYDSYLFNRLLGDLS